MIYKYMQLITDVSILYTVADICNSIIDISKSIAYIY